MRRSDREVTDPARIRAVIHACPCCRLGFWDGAQVYIVPLSFGYEEIEGRRLFYFHSATEGRKIDLIRAGGPVGFELDANYEVRPGETACHYSAAFESVIGAGRATLLTDPAQRAHALACIMAHYTGRADWTFPESQRVAVLQLEVETLCCKIHA